MYLFKEAFLDDRKVLSIKSLDLSSNLIEVRHHS